MMLMVTSLNLLFSEYPDIRVTDTPATNAFYKSERVI